MLYDFTSRNRGLGCVVFTLTLDKKRMTERVVIGEYDNARRCLDGANCDVYYDKTRPLGSTLFSFEGDAASDWSRQAAILRESYNKVFRSEERWKMTAPVSKFLREKFDSAEPTAMFAAIRTWEDYLNCYNMNHGAAMLTDRLATLYKPFRVYADYKPWCDEVTDTLRDALRVGEFGIELWYPMAKRPLETVVITSSFLPVIFFYRHRIAEWRLVFQQCKVCGKDFLARSRHYELCSDECRKWQAAEAKREFDGRAKGDRLEQLDEAAYYYWYNRLRKLRKTSDSDRVATFKAAFDDFRKEAVKRKSEVKRGEKRLTEFANWLIEQQNRADWLLEN